MKRRQMGSTQAWGGLEGILLAPLEPGYVRSCQPFFPEQKLAAVDMWLGWQTSW